MVVVLISRAKVGVRGQHKSPPRDGRSRAAPCRPVDDCVGKEFDHGRVDVVGSRQASVSRGTVAYRCSGECRLVVD